MRIHVNLTSRLLVCAWVMCCCFAPQQTRTVQIDISGLLNARPVTTLTGNKLISWTKGIDGNGDGDGYLTEAAASFKGDESTHALPNKPVFAANGQHPEIKLHYDNADSLHSQARFISGEGEFEIKVPKARYSAIFLGLSSSEGPSQLQFELVYADGSTATSYLLPDYYNNVSEKYPNLSYVATDLAKWGKKSIMAEKDHHNIHLLKLNSDPERKLKAIKVIKAKAGYLIFWSATGLLN